VLGLVAADVVVADPAVAAHRALDDEKAMLAPSARAEHGRVRVHEQPGYHAKADFSEASLPGLVITVLAAAVAVVVFVTRTDWRTKPT
jgi:hypothetical protein